MVIKSDNGMFMDGIKVVKSRQATTYNWTQKQHCNTILEKKVNGRLFYYFNLLHL